jgi:hypothetical protein
MGPANGRSLPGGAALVTLVVAIVVVAMVSMGGGVTRPLFVQSHTTSTQTAAQQAAVRTAQSQG